MSDPYEDAMRAQLYAISVAALQYGDSAELLTETDHPDAVFYRHLAESHRLMATDLAMLLGIVK